MRVHQIIKNSHANGPGNRYTVWVQGCSIQCPDCGNKATWPVTGGYERSIDELINDIPPETEGITITGGEPLDQYLEVFELLRQVYPKYNTFLTTGLVLPVIKAYYPMILKYIDILVDGPFMADRIDKTPAWRGSTNQNIYFLTERVQKYKDFKDSCLAEIHFNIDGSMTMTGFSIPESLRGV